MAQSADIRERLESAIASIPEDVDAAAIKVMWPVATYTISTGKVTTRDVFGHKSCGGETHVLDVAGTSATHSNGTASISLNAFHCEARNPGAGGGLLVYDRPITVVAVPRGTAPVHLAVEAEIGTDPSGAMPDVVINVLAWDANGAPVAVWFYWRCTVPVEQVPG